MVDFNTFLYNLNSMGFYNFVLPWILFLMIFFAILENAPFLKDSSKKKQIAIIVSAILALFTVNFPLNGIPLGQLLSDMFGWSSVYIAGILVVILFLGMGGFQLETLTGENKMPIAIILALLAVLVLSNAGFPLIQLDDVTWTLLFVVLLIGGAIMFLGDSETAEEKAKKAAEKKAKGGL